ncbi:MAG TPA: thioredoxin domain-containing protein [Solirubrobacterales bacterium]|nr:thioredoxin domain-containing protein [Solirubrobacterales bacterium]
MPNRLAAETSPYLLQHQNNPVDWYPWGEEALARAREEDRPILLSVGYSACHWCHVMERESFEDEATAAYMNEHFVPVKVDREERPDDDAIYMEAVQSMTGHGGWPMTVFLDPDGVPFYGGTYFPPDESRGMPSFRMVMEAVVDAFATKREAIRERAPEVRQRLGAIGAVEPRPGGAGEAELAQATERLLAAADRQYGGFGGAPKFPPASSLELLLARGEREVVRETLDAMLAGGIYDQLGGGFARYAVDRVWLVPHFEKMLYDNGLLATTYLHGWQAFGEERYRRVCEETLDWMLREMRGPEGGFYSALDADSEGEEGKFYVWFPEEIRALLGEEKAAPLLDCYGVSERGNFEGANVLHRAQGATAPEPPGLDAARARLLAAREERVRPGLDDKRLLAWNALAISALAEAGAVLERDDYVAAAQECASFVWETMRDDAGHLLRTYKDGEARLNAYLEDHAFLLEALLTLYEASFERRWFEAAGEVAEAMLTRFADPERGGFFSTSSDHEELIVRRKEVGDHPIPSGNSAAALGLLRLAALSGERRYRDAAEGIFGLFAKPASEHPDAFAHLLRAIDFATARVREVALVAPADADGAAADGGRAAADGGAVGAAVADLAAVVRAEYRPHLVLAAGPEGAEQPPLLAGRTLLDGRPAAYVCENFACQLPVSDPVELRALL